MNRFRRSGQSVAAVLWRKRFLLREMALLDMRDRYAGQAFGLFWAIVVPLLTMCVYLFIFALVFKAKMPAVAGDAWNGWGGSYALYLLSGLIPWMGFQEILTRSSTVITSNTSLVKQIVFPLEVLPLKIFLSSLLTQGIAVIVFFIYGLYCFGMPGPFILLLPVVFCFQLLAEAGCSLLLSAIGVFLRDIKDIIGVLCFILVYAMPIFYLPNMVPEQFSFIIQCNPLSHMIAMYHDVLFYGHISAWQSWCVFPLFAVVLWFVGCRVFEALKPLFGNVL